MLKRILISLLVLFANADNLSASAQNSDSISSSSNPTSEKIQSNFEFEHQLNRLFSVPTSRVLNSLDLSLLIGGAFGFEGRNNFLGTISLGLGGYGDIEISTASLIGSIFGSEESFGNLGLKIKVLPEEVRPVGLSIGLKTNNDWNNSSSGENEISDRSTDLFQKGLRSVNYDSRLTTLYIAVSKQYTRIVSFHGGISYSDLRYKNVQTIYAGGNASFNEAAVQKKNVFNVFAGLEADLNERTKFLLEVQTLPSMKVNTNNGMISPEKRVVGVAGLRFFITKWLLMDSGIRYQDNYAGLADAEIKIGLNAIWPISFK